MIESPVSLEWSISKERLEALRNSTTNEFLQTQKYSAFASSSGVLYYLRVYPNGNSEQNRGKVGLYLYVNPGNEKEIEAEYSISIESAGWNWKTSYKFVKNEGYGVPNVPNFFDESKKYFLEGKCVIKVQGWFKIPNTTSTSSSIKSFGDLWSRGYEDFTIAVGTQRKKKELKVHKNVLACQSPVFDAMFNSSMKEAVENKVKITDFPFEIVEAGIKGCYGMDLDPEATIETVVSVMKFADKYDIATLTDLLEKRLSEKMDATNVCELINLTSNANAVKLRGRAVDFLKSCIVKRRNVPNMDLIEKDLLLQVLQSVGSHQWETA